MKYFWFKRKHNWVMEVKLQTMQEGPTLLDRQLAAYLDDRREGSAKIQECVKFLEQRLAQKFNESAPRHLGLGRVTVTDVNAGCVSILVSGVMFLTGFISSYKDFWDGLFLLQEHAARGCRAIFHGWPEPVDVAARIFYPNRSDSEDPSFDADLPNQVNRNITIVRKSGFSFFATYLFIFNVALLSALTILVWKAIQIYLPK